MFEALGPLAKAYNEFEQFKKERREKTLAKVRELARDVVGGGHSIKDADALAEKHLDAILDAALPVTEIANRFGPDLLSFIAEKWKGLKK